MYNATNSNAMLFTIPKSIAPATGTPLINEGNPFEISLVISFSLSGPMICSTVPIDAITRARITTGI